MFNLIYRDGARENAGRYETLEKNAASTAFECGQAVELSEGKAVVTTGKVYGIVAADSPAGEGAVVVLKVEHDMVFSVPTTDVTGLVKGAKFAIATGSDNGKLGAKSETGAATIVDVCGATNVGDRVEVRFE
ncbi:MAG: hypothetical protein E7649_07850 [Ruminococcaceae bacterium]|nr:hypothetical protein [Oscillospiraceae bacterium]